MTAEVTFFEPEDEDYAYTELTYQYIREDQEYKFYNGTIIYVEKPDTWDDIFIWYAIGDESSDTGWDYKTKLPFQKPGDMYIYDGVKGWYGKKFPSEDSIKFQCYNGEDVKERLPSSELIGNKLIWISKNSQITTGKANYDGTYSYYNWYDQGIKLPQSPFGIEYNGTVKLKLSNGVLDFSGKKKILQELEGIESGHDYVIELRTYDKAGNKSQPTTLTFTTKPDTAGDIPENMELYLAGTFTDEDKNQLIMTRKDNIYTVEFKYESKNNIGSNIGFRIKNKNTWEGITTPQFALHKDDYYNHLQQNVELNVLCSASSFTNYIYTSLTDGKRYRITLTVSGKIGTFGSKLKLEEI